MAVVRIRGIWRLTLARYEVAGSSLKSLGEASLQVTSASRAGIEGELSLSRARIPVGGNVKPGAPAVVTLQELSEDGSKVPDGLEALLYIPPWLPSVDYSYDYITGIVLIGSGSAATSQNFGDSPVLVSGVQPFA